MQGCQQLKSTWLPYKMSARTGEDKYYAMVAMTLNIMTCSIMTVGIFTLSVTIKKMHHAA